MDDNEQQKLSNINSDTTKDSLKELEELILRCNKKLEAIEGRQRKTAWQWPSAFALTGLWIGYNIFNSGRPQDQIPSFVIIGISIMMFIFANVGKTK
jgi:hypothetical protein